MDLAKIIRDIAAGSATATPTTGSDAVDTLAGIPSDLLGYVAQTVNSLS